MMAARSWDMPGIVHTSPVEIYPGHPGLGMQEAGAEFSWIPSRKL